MKINQNSDQIKPNVLTTVSKLFLRPFFKFKIAGNKKKFIDMVIGSTITPKPIGPPFSQRILKVHHKK